MSDDRLEDIPRRLREYIEYATAARRFADVGFYQSVLAEVERLRSQHAEMVKFNERQYERAEKAEAALRRSVIALDDWLHTYAEELCDPESVEESFDRIRANAGTLAYIADVQRQNREALSAIEAKE